MLQILSLSRCMCECASARASVRACLGWGTFSLSPQFQFDSGLFLGTGLSQSRSAAIRDTRKLALLPGALTDSK